MRQSGREPRFAAFGGGTGLNTLLQGLKHVSSGVTAIVTVTDDGGSSGRLRQEFDIPAPGDIRHCLVALAQDENLLTKLFQFRFDEAELKGHNFGNLLLTALARITGDFSKAVEAASEILGIRGKVLPATRSKVSLVAEHADGSKSTGEVRIGNSAKPISRVSLRPAGQKISDEIRKAVLEADLLILGPGSLYTSIIPNLLVEGMLEAILASQAPIVYVCNVMTQPGETDGFMVEDHLAALTEHLGGIALGDFLDCVLVNDQPIPGEYLRRYKSKGAVPVSFRNRAELEKSVSVLTGPILGTRDFVRHDPERLAKLLMNMLK